MARTCIRKLTRLEQVEFDKPNNQWGPKDGGPKQHIDLLKAKCYHNGVIEISPRTVPNPDTLIDRTFHYAAMKSGGGYQTRLAWIWKATITGEDTRPKQEALW